MMSVIGRVGEANGGEEIAEIHQNPSRRGMPRLSPSCTPSPQVLRTNAIASEVIAGTRVPSDTRTVEVLLHREERGADPEILNHVRSIVRRGHRVLIIALAVERLVHVYAFQTGSSSNLMDLAPAATAAAKTLSVIRNHCPRP
jgi:hypothetical protein